MYEVKEFRSGIKVEIDGQPYIMVDCQFVKPGKGQAFSRTRLKHLETGAVLDRTFKSGERVPKAKLEEVGMQFLYAEGDGVPLDLAEAASWYQRAAELGDPEAHYRLGVAYADGAGVEQNLIRGYLWCQRAVRREVVEAVDCLDNLASRMTEEELAEAKRLAIER